MRFRQSYIRDLRGVLRNLYCSSVFSIFYFLLFRENGKWTESHQYDLEAGGKRCPIYNLVIPPPTPKYQFSFLLTLQLLVFKIIAMFDFAIGNNVNI